MNTRNTVKETQPMKEYAFQTTGVFQLTPPNVVVWHLALISHSGGFTFVARPKYRQYRNFT
jgi:hypothetical protein